MCVTSLVLINIIILLPRALLNGFRWRKRHGLVWLHQRQVDERFCCFTSHETVLIENCKQKYSENKILSHKKVIFSSLKLTDWRQTAPYQAVRVDEDGDPFACQLVEKQEAHLCWTGLLISRNPNLNFTYVTQCGMLKKKMFFPQFKITVWHLWFDRISFNWQIAFLSISRDLFENFL